MAKRADYDTCNNCGHTVNVHNEKDGVVKCSGYLCTCQNYELKKG